MYAWVQRSLWRERVRYTRRFFNGAAAATGVAIRPSVPFTVFPCHVTAEISPPRSSRHKHTHTRRAHTRTRPPCIIKLTFAAARRAANIWRRARACVQRPLSLSRRPPFGQVGRSVVGWCVFFPYTGPARLNRTRRAPVMERRRRQRSVVSSTGRALGDAGDSSPRSVVVYIRMYERVCI